MKDTDNTTSVQILGKSYDIKCPADRALELQEAGQYLDKKLREIQQAGNMRTGEQTALMAALNISHELIISRKQCDNYIKVMQQEVQALAETD